MTLKSTSLFGLKKGKKSKRRTGTRDLVTAGVGALIGTAFVVQTADIIKGL